MLFKRKDVILENLSSNDMININIDYILQQLHNRTYPVRMQHIIDHTIKRGTHSIYAEDVVRLLDTAYMKYYKLNGNQCIKSGMHKAIYAILNNMKIERKRIKVSRFNRIQCFVNIDLDYQAFSSLGIDCSNVQVY